jgi:TetR/AcrR family transcriptional repressor of mexJK operon
VQITVGRPKDLEKRQQILQAAKDLFLRCGYHGSSMNQIAKEARVTKLTVYNHFQDKENLFCCAIAETCEESISARKFLLSPDCDFKAELSKACQLALDVIYLPEAIKLDILLVELAAEKSPLAQRFYDASHLRMCRVWEDLFSQAIELGFISEDDVLKQTQLILSLLLGMRHHEVLLGIATAPTAQEKQQIITESIELFMLKYHV